MHPVQDTRAPVTGWLSLDRTRVLIYVGIGLAALVNLLGVAAIMWLMTLGQNEQDWRFYTEAGERAWAGLPLYDWSVDYEFRYSPVLAYAFGVIAPIGIVGWRLVSLASLLLLPRRLMLVALIAMPIWLDLYAGNVTTIVFALAVCALSGQRWAIAAYLVALILIPRPLMVPVAVYLLWQHPEWRLRFVALLVGHAAIAWLFEPAWFGSLLGGRSDFASYFDFGPARFIGWAWIPLGVALAAWLTWKGRLGYASLAASPYWLAYYPLMLLLELRPRHR